jgi:predicted Fe-Mo cluster-binding NifX family protein
MTSMVVCVPVTAEGWIDPRWGRADRVALAEVADGAVVSWNELDVGWSRAHDAGPEGSHHARIARFLIEHRVEAVVANHMGEGMLNMLRRMGLDVRLGAQGDARAAAAALAG